MTKRRKTRDIPLEWVAAGVDTHSSADLHAFCGEFLPLVRHIGTLVGQNKVSCSACGRHPLTLDTRFDSYSRGLMAIRLRYAYHDDLLGFAVCQACVLAYGSTRVMVDEVSVGIMERLTPSVAMEEEPPTPRVEKVAREAVDDLWDRLGVRPPQQSPSPEPSREPSKDGGSTRGRRRGTAS